MMSKHTKLLLLALSLMALSLSPDFVAQGSSAGDIDTMHANKIGFQRMAPPLATADGVKQDMPRNEEILVARAGGRARSQPHAQDDRASTPATR